jgi:hypothetical protein
VSTALLSVIPPVTRAHRVWKCWFCRVRCRTIRVDHTIEDHLGIGLSGEMPHYGRSWFPAKEMNRQGIDPQRKT